MQSSPLSVYIVNLSNFDKRQKLKQGGFGSVYKVIDKKTGQTYVAKILSVDSTKIDEETKEKMINREIQIMLSVNNPTLIKIHYFSKFDFNNEPNVTLIMDYFKNGSLYDVLKQAQIGLADFDYSNTKRQIILIGISRGMKYLHSRKIIHRDLSSNNILLDDEFYPVITDFGLSKFTDVNEPKIQSFFGGTFQYMAPEVLQNRPYDFKADVYSFGIIMYEVVTGLDPYPEFTKKIIFEYDLRKSIVEENYRPKFIDPIKNSLKELIEQCWSADPMKRPTFSEIFDKLSSIENVNEKSFTFDHINVSEIEDYVEMITEINDPYEELINQIETSDCKISNS